MKNERIYMLSYHFLIYSLSLKNYKMNKKKQFMNHTPYFFFITCFNIFFIGKCTDYNFFFQSLFSSLKYISLYNMMFNNDKLKMIDLFRIYKQSITYGLLNFIIIERIHYYIYKQMKN